MVNPVPATTSSTSSTTEVNTGQKIVLRAPQKLLKPLVTQALAQHVSMCNKDIGEFYGQPTPDYQNQNDFRPEIQLFFVPNKGEVAKLGYSYQTKTHFTLRLVTETTESMTNQKIQTIKNRINANFGGAEPFQWHKGKTLYTYFDKLRGYDFSLLCINLDQAKIIIETAMKIQGHTPDWKKLFITANAEPDEKYPTATETEQILGETVVQPHRRPEIVVHYNHTLVHIHGRKRAIEL